ncbi:unnamed protein product [Rhizopus stolonifer]
MTEKLMEKYILENFLRFDPVIFFETTCKNLDCDAATEFFEKTIDLLANDTKKPYNVVNWCLNVKSHNYEILNTMKLSVIGIYEQHQLWCT